jgi:glycosyltransferase involved in cell wall biosynthesis
MQNISVIVITYNEEHNVERCLHSVQWADEIIVVDAFSTDRTVAIARKCGATVVHHEWEGYGKQKAFALSCAAKDWVFSIDADEEVPNDLREEIRSTIASSNSADGYEIARKSFFLGTWIRHGGWYPGYQLRLFKRAKARVNARPVHEGFDIAGNIDILSASLLHYTYNSIYQYIEKMNAYTSLDVVNKLGEDARRFRWYHCVLNPLSAFLRMFISLKGYRDGIHGFLVAYYSGISVMVLSAKCWEYQSAHRTGDNVPPVTPEDVAHLKRLT